MLSTIAGQNKKFISFEERRQALHNLSLHLQDETFASNLVAAYMKDTGFLRKNVIEREIVQPVALLDQIGRKSLFADEYALDFSAIQPLGKVAVLLPFNGVNIMLAKAVGSSFLAGNKTIVKLPRKLKHAAPYYKELVSANLSNIQFVSDTVPSEHFLNACIESPDISAIVIYGDDEWVWSYKNAVRRNNKKLIFEGPGKDPQVVFQDADPELAVADAVACGLLNGGQSCSSLERFFVHTDLVNEFTERLADKLKVLTVGHHEDDETDIGAIYSDRVLHRIMEQVLDAQNRNGKILLGGFSVDVPMDDKVAFLPTIITNCTTDMRVVREETFGPVFPILSFSSEAELMTMLDCTNYGLNASLYGTCSEKLFSYMENSHRNFYHNSTVTSPINTMSRILDGGYKHSGFIWEWRNNNFIQREGKRLLLKELSLE
jgi:acyl-CoA reductase-like NAD-dependent aldehyde dehydrogenase